MRGEDNTALEAMTSVTDRPKKVIKQRNRIVDLERVAFLNLRILTFRRCALADASVAAAASTLVVLVA
jgi:hypothetical protein